MCYSRKRGRKRGWGTERERNVERLVEWLKWESTCLACAKPWVQTPVLPEKKKKKKKSRERERNKLLSLSLEAGVWGCDAWGELPPSYNHVNTDHRWKAKWCGHSRQKSQLYSSATSGLYHVRSCISFSWFWGLNPTLPAY
jgi:hypothetical protein